MDEKHVAELVNNCSVARLLGIEIYEVREGAARGRLKLRKEHHNMFGMPHGGVLFTLADQVSAACGNTLGKKAVAVESTIHFMKAARGQDMIFSEATVTHVSRSIGRIDAKVYTTDGDVVARMHQIFYIKDEPHETDASRDI